LRKSGDATADDWSDPMAGKSVCAVQLRHIEKQRHRINGQHKKPHYKLILCRDGDFTGIPFPFFVYHMHLGEFLSGLPHE